MLDSGPISVVELNLFGVDAWRMLKLGFRLPVLCLVGTCGISPGSFDELVHWNQACLAKGI